MQEIVVLVYSRLFYDSAAKLKTAHNLSSHYKSIAFLRIPVSPMKGLV